MIIRKATFKNIYKYPEQVFFLNIYVLKKGLLQSSRKESVCCNTADCYGDPAGKSGRESQGDSHLQQD